VKNITKFVVYLLLMIPFAVSAATFSFTQEGFSEGAVISVTFTGHDTNMDTQITTAEVTAFDLSFSGNSIVAPFTLGLADLFGLVYDPDGGPLGDGVLLSIEGIAAGEGFKGGFMYTAGPGPMEICGQEVDCAVVSDGSNQDFSSQLLVFHAAIVYPVPTLSLLGMIFLILVLFLVPALRRRIATTR